MARIGRPNPIKRWSSVVDIAPWTLRMARIGDRTVFVDEHISDRDVGMDEVVRDMNIPWLQPSSVADHGDV